MPRHDHSETASPAQQRTDGLQLSVVHYTDQPDRCTVSPPQAVDCDRLTTWLSVNREVLYSLDTMR